MRRRQVLVVALTAGEQSDFAVLDLDQICGFQDLMTALRGNRAEKQIIGSK